MSTRKVILCLAFAAFGCKSSEPSGQIGDDPTLVDADGDAIPDGTEDRNRNGQVDPGETDPRLGDTDGDGIPDGSEVQFIACSPVMDRPFRVYDAPGAGSMVMTDARVSEAKILRTMDNRAPAIALADAEVDVAAVLIQKRSPMGVGNVGDMREYERRNTLAMLGTVSNQRTRALTTVEGFEAEQATFELAARGMTDARSAANTIARATLLGVPLTGLLTAGGQTGTALTVNMLTVQRSARVFVIMVAIAVGPTPTEQQELRLEELTDGTNVARRGSFTRHVCDEFEAKAEAKADIIFVVDDSGSMEDDQMAVREAANAMETVLTSAQIDFRLGVAATRATDRTSVLRGRLSGGGMTANVADFKRRIVVGADGGWEPGLETGILAIDRLLPRTAAGAASDPDKLREGAATVIIHLSDERDQAVECAACGACDGAEGEGRMCTDPSGQRVIDDFVQQYTARGAVTFAIVGDIPSGCRQPGMRDDFEPGQGYVEVANATGGKFGSLCGDMTQNLMDVARVASGVASAYRLTMQPASATLRVAIGPPGQGRAIARSRTDGFDYDPVQNTVIFYGASRPQDGDEVVIGYRRWDWANNPTTPADPCDECETGTQCLPELDNPECKPLCGEVICEPGLICFEAIGDCGDPNNPPVPPATACGECDAGLVCDERIEQCVPPCEVTGCDPTEMCDARTHLCEEPRL